MWCFACCRFPQHPSSAHQDPWFFQHLRYSHFSKFSTLSRYRICGPTRSEISRQLLVWAYHEWCVRFYVRRACKVLFLPEISSQNTAAFCIRCVGGEKWLWGCRDSHSQFPGSLLWTPGTFGAKTIHLATKYDEERLAVFSLELSYGSSSSYLIFYAFTRDHELLPILFWNTRGIEAVVSGQLKSSAKMQSASSSLSWTFLRSKLISLFSYILIAYQLSFSFVKATIECNRVRCGTESSN